MSTGLSGKWRERVFSAVLLSLAMGLLWMARTSSPDAVRRWFAPVPFDTPLNWLLLLAAVLAAMLLHEAGHLLASMMLGFQVLGGSLGPLHMQMLPGDVKVSWAWKTLGTASISAVPRTMDHWRGSLLMVIAAGPTMTLVSALMAVCRPVTVFNTYFLQVSLLLFVLGLIPNSRNARRQNDARLFLDLLRRPGSSELELKIRLKQLMLSGVRPQDYPQELLRRLAAFRGRREAECAFAQALAQWASDCDEIELASDWDLRALELAGECGGSILNAALASSACFDLVFRQDRESAALKFAQVDCQALFPTCFAQRSAAASLIACGRLHRASAHILRAQYALPRGNRHYELERSLLERLHAMALGTQSTPDTKSKAASA
jgi:hypothetical protein